MAIVATKIGTRLWVHTDVPTGIAGVDFNLANIGNANASIPTSTTVVALTAALTADRTWQLPAANTVPAGSVITVIDKAAYLGTYKVIITPTSGDLINDQSSYNFIKLGGFTNFFSDGNNNWVTNHSGGSTGPSWAQMTQAAYDALTPKDANTLYVIVG